MQANAILEKTGFVLGRGGRMEVNPFLQAKDYPEVFAGGDCALSVGKNGRPMPPTAWLAVQHGQTIAENIFNVINGQELRTVEITAPALILSIERRKALGIVFGKRLTGAFAGFVKDILAFRHIYHIGGLPLTLKKLWEWGPYLIHMHRRRS